MDFNFDGYSDIEILHYAGASGFNNSHIFLYDPIDRKLVYQKGFSDYTGSWRDAQLLICGKPIYYSFVYDSEYDKGVNAFLFTFENMEFNHLGKAMVHTIKKEKSFEYFLIIENSERIRVERINLNDIKLTTNKEIENYIRNYWKEQIVSLNNQ